MPNGENHYDADFVEHLNRFVGETVTIFTLSGGESGSGFTGVVLAVNDCFVRLLTQIGPAPGCALGNACDYDRGCCGFFGRSRRNYRNWPNRYGNYGNGYINTVGSVTDIPLDRIASFVHNAV